MLLSTSRRVQIALAVALVVQLSQARAATPPAIPAAAGRPALALPENAPGLADLKLPAVLKPGTRICYHGGDSVVAGVAARLKPVPGKNGQYIDPTTGQNYDESQVKSSGGVGYVQLNVVAATADLVAMDARNFQIVDVQRDVAVSAGGTAVTGNAASAGAYWVHPALLALISAQGGVPQPAEVKIDRMKYALGPREYNAVSIANDYASGFDHSVYDAETGLLLYRAGSTLGEGVPVVDPTTGKVSRGKGSTVIYHTAFIGAAELNIPWADQPPPEWVAKGREFQYAGDYASVTQFGSTPPLGAARLIQIAGVSAGVALVRTNTRTELGPGLPAQESREERFFGSAMFNPLWIGPKAFEKLQPNQVLDEDRVTKFRTVFQGAQNGAATFVEQGPSESTQYIYDLRTGVLLGARATRQTPAGQIQSQLMLKQQ